VRPYGLRQHVRIPVALVQGQQRTPQPVQVLSVKGIVGRRGGNGPPGGLHRLVEQGGVGGQVGQVAQGSAESREVLGPVRVSRRGERHRFPRRLGRLRQDRDVSRPFSQRVEGLPEVF